MMKFERRSLVRRRLPLLGLLLAGLLAGLLWAWGYGAAWSQGNPSGWSRERPAASRGSVPVAALAPGPDAWILGRRESMQADQAAESLRVRVQLADKSILTVLLGSGHDVARGPALVLDGARGELRVEHFDLMISHDQGARKELEPQCLGSLGELDAAVLEVALQRVPEGLELQVPGGTVRCACQVPPGPPVLVVGLHEVALSDLCLDGRCAPRPGATWLFPVAGLVGALLALSLGWLELRIGLSLGAVLLGWAPILLGLAALSVPPASLARAWRVQALSTPWLAVGVGLAGVVALKLCLWAAHGLRLPPAGRALERGIRLRVGLVLVALPLAVVGLAGAAGATQPLALAGFGLAALGLGLLLLLNRNADRFRWFNPLSLLVLGLSLFALEVGVRHTLAGQAWAWSWSWAQGLPAQDEGSGFVDDRAPTEEAAANPALWILRSTQVTGLKALLEIEDPGYHFNIQPPSIPARSAPVRIVCMGGSSTANGERPEERARSWAGLLGHSLGPSVESLNMGVGAWTSYQIRLYLERQLDALDPDLLILYTGNNDAGLELPVSLEQLHGHWQKNRGSLRLLAPLRGLVLYQGLATILRASMRPELVPTVSLAEAENNLRQIAAMARARGARLLLMSEGVGPSAWEDVRPYHLLQQRIAEEEGALWLDGGAALREAGPGVFWDDVHMTDSGHRVLVGLLQKALVAEGLVAEPAAPMEGPAQGRVESGELQDAP